ncbi:unnamed protein product, partial [Notodromas monacha]
MAALIGRVQTDGNGGLGWMALPTPLEYLRSLGSHMRVILLRGQKFGLAQEKLQGGMMMGLLRMGFHRSVFTPTLVIEERLDASEVHMFHYPETTMGFFQWIPSCCKIDDSLYKKPLIDECFSLEYIKGSYKQDVSSDGEASSSFSWKETHKGKIVVGAQVRVKDTLVPKRNQAWIRQLFGSRRMIISFSVGIKCLSLTDDPLGLKFWRLTLMAFLRLLMLLVVGVAAAGADCGPKAAVPVSGRLRQGGEGRRRLRASCDICRGNAVPGLCPASRPEGGEAVVANGLRQALGRHGSCRDALEVVRGSRAPQTGDLDSSSSAGDEPRLVAPTANLAVVHVPVSKTPYVVRTPPSTQQSVVVAQEVPHVIRAPLSTPEVTVNIKHGVAHVEADVDPWTAMVLVFMGLGGAGATSLAVFLVWLVKFIRNK